MVRFFQLPSYPQQFEMTFVNFISVVTSCVRHQYNPSSMIRSSPTIMPFMLSFRRVSSNLDLISVVSMSGVSMNCYRLRSSCICLMQCFFMCLLRLFLVCSHKWQNEQILKSQTLNSFNDVYLTMNSLHAPFLVTLLLWRSSPFSQSMSSLNFAVLDSHWLSSESWDVFPSHSILMIHGLCHPQCEFLKVLRCLIPLYCLSTKYIHAWCSSSTNSLPYVLDMGISYSR